MAYFDDVEIVTADVPQAIATHRNDPSVLHIVYCQLEALRERIDRSESVDRGALIQRVEQSKAIILAILGEGK